MPEVDLMDKMTTMGLGQHISFDLYLQNYEQLEELYGKQRQKRSKATAGIISSFRQALRDRQSVLPHAWE